MRDTRPRWGLMSAGGLAPPLLGVDPFWPVPVQGGLISRNALRPGRTIPDPFRPVPARPVSRKVSREQVVPVTRHPLNRSAAFTALLEFCPCTNMPHELHG